MRHLFVLFCLFALGSCQRQYFYRPATTQAETAKPVYNQGVPSLRFEENGIELSLDLTAHNHRDLNLSLHIRNHGDSVFNFFPEQIRATGFNAAGAKTDLRVFTPRQYQRRQNAQIALVATTVAAGAMAGALAIADKINDNAPADEEDHDDSDGWYWVTATTPAILLLPDARPNAIPGSGLLRTHSIAPGEAVQGVVKVQGRSSFSDKIVVEIPINGAYKRFVFDARSRRH